MKKLFQIVGVLTLLLGSFIYTNKIATVMKDEDEIMNEIKYQNELSKIKVKEAKISNNTIIPGIKGKEIDINKSYNQMKKEGKYNQSLLIYKNVYPKINLKNTYDKYIISGNETKKSVSIILLVNDNNDIEKLINIFNKNKLKANIFITSKFLEKNKSLIFDLIKQKHIIGNQKNYDNGDFVWMKSIIINGAMQKNNYCYTENKNKNILKICKLQKSYTIIPKTITKNHLIKTKSNLKNGALLAYTVNDELNDELTLIINYIESKGYKIENLYEHLKE